MTRLPAEHPWRVPVALQEIPETGRSFELTADECTRAAIAEVAGLRALPRLTATFDVSRHGRGGLHVVGQVSATVGQVCIVTLEPMQNEIEEAVDVVFVPGVPGGGTAETAAGSRATDGDDTDALAADPPEPLIDGKVDLGAIATEFLVLGIDPYPRKPDAVFAPPAAADDDAAHPFAALAALRKPSNRDDG